MRRVLIVAALGWLWGQAAWAQGEPQIYGEDYAPADPVWPFPVGSTAAKPLDVAQGFCTDWPERQESEKALEALLATLLRDTPHFQLGGAKNVDASYLEEVIRSKSGLSWKILHTADLIVTGEDDIDWSLVTAYPRFDMLYVLCFLDVLSPLEVGPDMGPIFKEPLPGANNWYIGSRPFAK